MLYEWVFAWAGVGKMGCYCGQGQGQGIGAVRTQMVRLNLWNVQNRILAVRRLLKGHECKNKFKLYFGAKCANNNFDAK